MPDFEPVDHDPFADVSVNPVTGDPFIPAFAAPVQNIVSSVAQGAVQQKATPGAVMQPNPYPEGSEEASWYNDQRQNAINQWGPGQAFGMIGQGMPLATRGAAGVAGGKLGIKAGEDLPGINWDRGTVSRGELPIYGDKQVIDVPVDALDRAFKATDPRMYVDSPKPEVAEYAASGKPMSVPEVDADSGRLGFTNGRNRFAAARDAGEATIPVATETPDELRALLAKHGGKRESAMGGKIKAFHAAYEPFSHYDWSRLGKVTVANTDSEWAHNLAKLGPWASETEVATRMVAPHSLPVTIGGKGMKYKSLDDLEAAIRDAGGPNEFRDAATNKGYGHVKVQDEEFGTNSYIALAPEHFTIEPPDELRALLAKHGGVTLEPVDHDPFTE